MKRKILVFLLFIVVAAMASAQGVDRRRQLHRQAPGQLPPSEAVTVSGSMIVAHGFPAVQSGNVTYLVRGISRLTGFVDGLNEGAQVTIEGRAMPISRDGNLKFLQPSNLTLSDRSYDLAMPWGRPGVRPQRTQDLDELRERFLRRHTPQAPRHHHPRHQTPRGRPHHQRWL